MGKNYMVTMNTRMYQLGKRRKIIAVKGLCCKFGKENKAINSNIKRL